MSKSRVKLLLVVSGSVSAYKAANLVSQLKKSECYEVRIVLTEAGARFIGATTLEALSGHRVHSDLWQGGEVMEHIELGKWADAMLVYPATANLINSWSSGLARDLAGNVYLAFPENRPIVIAPAMNTRMLAHPATQQSLSVLAQRGAHVMDTGVGSLACGEFGSGRLIEPDAVIDVLNRLCLETEVVSRKSLKSEKILVVYGGTKVPIDRVRAITNTSTGATGAFLVNHFTQKGFAVDVLRARNSVAPLKDQQVAENFFETYDELEDQLQEILGERHYDFVIQLAAVSDYQVLPSKEQKITSGDKVTLTLIPTQKLVNQLKQWSIHKIGVVAYKLTVAATEDERVQAVRKVFERGGVDWVVHNDLNEMEDEIHQFSIFDKSLNVIESGRTVGDMADALGRLQDIKTRESRIEQEVYL
ncbi:MAG: bifunctional phosphopantothenoylcysteine decarboxylase/phosphopantothenate--cysteine ligase CoaBC [Pseudomonadota bacterium]